MSDDRPTPAWLRPVSELLAEQPVFDDPPPVTPEEGRELLRRINAPGGAKLVLNVAEHDFVFSGPAPRDGGQVERLHRALEQDGGDGLYVRGIRAGLAYAEGRTPAAPLTGHQPGGLPRCRDLYREVAMANESLQGLLDQPFPHPQDYVVGVEATCLWLICHTDMPPIDLDT